MNPLMNNFDRQTLEKKLEAENFKRITISFYKYVKIENPHQLRDELYRAWDAMGVLGRIYVAEEGINAQLNVPEHNFEMFKKYLYSFKEFKRIPFKVGVEQGKSFIKLTIKVKKQIVADGLLKDKYDLRKVGNHLTPEEFNKAMDDPETIVVDMRNHYESRIGHFKNAVTPDCDTFKEELPMVVEELKDKKDKKVLLYCTGGIRCEKASAYFKHEGFKDVNQLYGGIINYAHEIKEKGLENKFVGKNFVFDERLAEAISEDVISECDQCGSKSDRQINCANEMCHLLFIQCDTCGDKMNNTCCNECKEIAELPIEKRRKLRKGNKHKTVKNHYSDRLRPKLKVGA